MSATATPSPSQEIRQRVYESTPYWGEKFAFIIDKQGRKVRLKPKRGQLELDALLEGQRAEGKPMRVISLKARQIGVSTWVQTKLCHRCTLRENYDAVTVAHDKETGGKLFRMFETVYGNLPDDPTLKPAANSYRRSQFLHLTGEGTWQRGDAFPNSRYTVDTAGEFQAGRGGTYRAIHACFPAETPILVGDGRVKRADEIEVDDPVVTHTGKPSRVSAITSRPNEQEMIEITPWLGEAIRLTPNHEVWTQRGWVRADELTEVDRLSMPVRPITGGIRALGIRPKVRPRGPSANPKPKAPDFPLNEETGFAVGYYLAEGCVFFNRGHEGARLPAGICFARDQGEVAFADRAETALSAWVTSRRTTDRRGSRTSYDTLYGASLAEMMVEEFGHGADKRVPDWVFDAGPKFARGMLLGYLSGDGSKVAATTGGYETARVSATSIRASLSFQMRDLAASLGYGWAGVRRKEAAVRSGRTEREAWTVTWSGSAARDLRRDLGLPVPPTGRGWIEKARIDGGAVWVEIRQLRSVKPDETVYDIEVEDEDHSFRTAHFAISNSEVAFWQQIPTKLAALMSAVPKDPETLFVMESTANGYNEFKDRWDDAEEGRVDWIPFFWPWWKEEEYRLPFASETEAERFQIGDPTHPYAEEEPDLVEHHDLDIEQLNWRRYTIGNEFGGDLRIFDQEYPTTPEHAFIATGQKVFDPYKTAQIMIRVDDTDPRQRSEANPGPLVGDFTVTAKREDPSRSGGTVEVPTAAAWTPRQPGIVNATPPWRLWLPPGLDGAPQHPEGDFIIGVDVSGGKTETTDEPDYHAIEVIDHKSREQVAEYRSRIDPDLLAREVLMAALFFNEAVVAIERTGSWGQPILRILYLDMHYPHLYRSKKVGNTSERTENRIGWDTNVRTKPLLIAGMAELIRIGEDGIKSRTLAAEARGYTRTEKGTTEAEPGDFDDALMAYMIAQFVAAEMPMRSAFSGSGGAQEAGFVAGGPGAYDGRRR